VGLLVGGLIMTSNLMGAFWLPVAGLLYHRYDMETLILTNRGLIIMSYGAALLMVFYDLYLEKATRQINILLENFKKSKKNDEIWLRDLYISPNSIRRASEINYYLFAFAFFYIPSVVCFNNFGSSYLLEKHFSAFPLKEAYFKVSLVFCLLWSFATFSSSLMSFYLLENPPSHHFLIYFSFLAVFGHFSFLFFWPYLAALCLGISYGSSFSVFVSLIEKNKQREDHILCFANLGIMVSCYLLAFVSQNGPFYYHCELVLFILAILSFLVAVGFFHYKEMEMKGRREQASVYYRKGEDNKSFELENLSRED
jgi:hypothetical protein